METFWQFLGATVLGGGAVGAILVWAAKGKASEWFAPKGVELTMVPKTECELRHGDVEAMRQDYREIRAVLQNYGARLQSLEQALLVPVERMADRLDKLVEKDVERELAFVRTVQTLEMVAKNQERMEKRLEQLERRD